MITMDKSHDDDNLCVQETLKKILEVQKKVKKKECDPCKISCKHSIDKLLHFPYQNKKNTIPFILNCNCEPYKVDGVTTCIDPCSDKEKFICFTTFIFRIKDIKRECAVLELLKFRKHHQCSPSSNDHVCSPCCQLHCEDVDDLISTGVCITVDLSCFCSIQCLPAICL